MKTVIVLVSFIVSFIVLTHEARVMNAPVFVPGTTYQQTAAVIEPNGQVVPAEVIATPQGYAEVIPVAPVAPVNSQFSRGMNPVVGTAPVVEVVPVAYSGR